MEKLIRRKRSQLPKAQIFCVFICMTLFFSIGSQLSAQDAPSEVIQAAGEGLPVFFHMFSQQAAEQPHFKIEDFGFEENDSLDQAYLGEAFQLHELTPNTILNYQQNTPVDSLLSKTEVWYFLVMIDEEVKAILIVDKMKDVWQTVALGKAKIAKELGKIRQQWPREKGYTPLLITCYYPNEYLFTVPQYDAYNLTLIPLPGVDGAREESIDYSELENSYNVISELRSMY